MKKIFLLTIICLSTLAINCKQQIKSASNTPQDNRTQVQPSPVRAERGTPAEAQAMLRSAVAHYQAVGRKQALADFSGKKPQFFDRDLYVFCVGANSSTLTANGAFPQYVGMSVDVWKDADGKPLGKAIQDAARKNDQGSIEYRMSNPLSGQIEPKISFWQKLGEDVCGVGAYNPRQSS